nr:FIST C-terminal domain-containing protein [Myxococcota bacterium]
GAATQVVSAFSGLRSREYPYRAALVLTDALAGHADDLIEQLTVATSGAYEFAGGGAGDDAKFERTHVFYGTRVLNDAVVALEILSTKPLGIGVQHGWQPASETLRVTEVDGARVIALDGFPAIEAFEVHASQTGQQLDRTAPLPFFLHNILGIDTPQGHRLRVPLSVDADGAVTCAAEIPAGARVHIMRASATSSTEAAAEATRAAVRALGGSRPAGALFFDCIATRLRLGDVFGFELEAVQAALGSASLVGCNTYGQIARADGQFGGFHNCTAVVLAFPQ